LYSFVSQGSSLVASTKFMFKGWSCVVGDDLSSKQMDHTTGISLSDKELDSGVFCSWSLRLNKLSLYFQIEIRAGFQCAFENGSW